MMVASVGIVIPAYKPDLSQLSQYIHTIRERIQPMKIIIEIDGGAQDSISRLSDLPVGVYNHPSRRGKGAAITAGFEKLESDILAFADADGSTPVDELERIIDSVGTDTSDIAIGSRRHPDSTIHSNQTITRRYLGDAFVHLARVFLGSELYDFQCGAKAITHHGWEEIRGDLYESGFAWDLELIAIAASNGLRIEEVPIQWYDRPQSTVDPLRTSIDMVRALLLIRYRIGLRRNSTFCQKISRIYTDPRSPLIENSSSS